MKYAFHHSQYGAYELTDDYAATRYAGVILRDNPELDEIKVSKFAERVFPKYSLDRSEERYEPWRTFKRSDFVKVGVRFLPRVGSANG
jgi:hypothetical protein